MGAAFSNSVRWQKRFAAQGVDGLLRDRTRPSRIAKLDPLIAERAVAPTMEEPAPENTHWTGTARAKAGRRHRFVGTRRLARTDSNPIASDNSRCPKTLSSSTNCATLSGSMSIRRRTPSSSASTKRARSTRSTERSSGCRSKRGPPRKVTHDYRRNGTTPLRLHALRCASVPQLDLDSKAPLLLR
jgi:hypothetical protein